VEGAARQNMAFTPQNFFRGVRADQQRKYELKSHLGKGAYGEVWASTLAGASDGEKFAIKKINNAFCQATEAKRMLRELRILRHLNHPNVIRIRDILRPQSESNFSDLWIVFDFVDLDLRKLIASPQNISMAHIQWIAHQMLSALQYMHSAHVLHRDLKPANILLSESCVVKVCDFGLARVVDEEDWVLNEQRLQAAPALQRQLSSTSMPPPMTRQMTSHVVTRWYRAPELILLQRYTTAIDVWSFACIFAELLMMLPEAELEHRDRTPLFPGRSCLPLSPVESELAEPNLDQLNVIFRVIGTPTRSVGWVEMKEMRDHLNSLSPIPRTPLRDLYPASPDTAIDLLERILQFEPSRRCSVADAMDHPFFDGMKNKMHLQLASQPVDAATIDFEHSDFKVGAIRRLVVQEIHRYAERATTGHARKRKLGADDDAEQAQASSSSASTTSTATPSPAAAAAPSPAAASEAGSTADADADGTV